MPTKRLENKPFSSLPLYSLIPRLIRFKKFLNSTELINLSKFHMEKQTAHLGCSREQRNHSWDFQL